jgi:hypothetical protein
MSFPLERPLPARDPVEKQIEWHAAISIKVPRGPALGAKNEPALPNPGLLLPPPLEFGSVPDGLTPGQRLPGFAPVKRNHRLGKVRPSRQLQRLGLRHAQNPAKFVPSHNLGTLRQRRYSQK